jgi:Asp-tRNA(Asn)/Glu-tRNA(Gln) amidotransferase A subunit family amidase
VTNTVAEIVASHGAGTSPEDTVARCYARIRAHDDPAVFITLRDESDARAEARALRGGPGERPLFGVPIAIKDDIDVKDLPTTAACPAFAYKAGSYAAAVSRLRQAGAIVMAMFPDSTAPDGTMIPSACVLISYRRVLRSGRRPHGSCRFKNRAAAVRSR